MVSSNKKALITGATGYIGRYFIRYLRQRNWLVVAMVRDETVAREVLSDVIANSTPDKISFVKYTSNTKEVSLLIQEHQPDAVFHLASVAITQHCSEDVDNILEVNIRLPTQLMESMNQYNHGKFVSVGSAWQHYNGASYDPIGLYGATKQSVENIAQYYCGEGHLKAVQLKIFHAYGEQDPRKRIMRILAEASLSTASKPLDMSNGHQMLNLVYIDDVCRGLLMAYDLAHEGFKSFSLETKDWITVRSLAGLFEQASGNRLDIRWGALDNAPREFLAPASFGDVLPGWKEEVSLIKGIHKLLQQSNCI